MTRSKETALIVGRGPGVSASCARRFAREGMSVAIVSRTPNKPELLELQETHGVRPYVADAGDPESVAAIFAAGERDLGAPRLIVHNIDGRSGGIFAGLAQSMARELMPQGDHVAHCPIDGAIACWREDGTRAHWIGGEAVDDNMLDPDQIAETYLHLHGQHRSTWTFEAVMRPWLECW